MVGLTNDDPATKAPVFKESYTVCGQYGRSVAASAWATVHCPPTWEKFRYVIIQGSHNTSEALCLKEVDMIVRHGKGLYILYSASSENLTSQALRYGSHSFTLQTYHTCLNLVRVHQTAPQLTSNSSHGIVKNSLLLIYPPRENERLSWPS